MAKEEDKQDRLQTVLYNLVESISVGATLLEAFMPDTSAKILAQLHAEKRELTDMDAYGKYVSGTKVVEKPEILFQRLDAKEIMEKVAVIQAEQKAAAQKANGMEKGIEIEAKEEVTYEDFMKMQFQVGKIIACEEVPKSKKLLCSKVQIGNEVKQIVSGIKAHYSAEEMVGKRVMVLVNLKPAKLAGVLSEGMILCAENEKGELAIMVPEPGKEMPAGAEIA